jgi:hypothetical protein
MVWVGELGRNTYIHTYVCMYVHTCYVLTNPSSRCKYFVVLRPVEILMCFFNL